MTIEFLTEDDLYVLPLFEEYFRHFSGEFKIVRVSCCPVMGSRRRVKLMRDLLGLYGPTGFLRLLMRHAASTILSRLPRSRGASKYHSIAQLCAAYEVPYGRVDNPNSPEFVKEVRDGGTDLLISVACPYILKRAILEAPPMGCINIHNAPLPRYKGMMPTFWQMFHGEETVGLTIHYMTEKIDNGGVLFQDHMEVAQRETLDSLIRRCKRRAAQCLATVLRQLEHGTANPVPLTTENSTYFTFPRREEIREFRRRGLRAI